MIVKIQRKGRVQAVEADLVTVEDSCGNPLAVAAQTGPGEIIVVSSIDSGEAAFNNVLHGLGIDKTVVQVDVGQSLKPPESLPTIVGRK